MRKRGGAGRASQVPPLHLAHGVHSVSQHPPQSTAVSPLFCRDTAYIPQWLAPATAFLRTLGQAANEWIMEMSYISNSEDYTRRIAAQTSRQAVGAAAQH